MTRVARLALFSGLALTLVGRVAAQTVSVMVATPPGRSSGPVVEGILSGAMDALFDAGRIVTNGTAFEVVRESWELDPRDLREAQEGRVEYLALLYVQLERSTLKPGLDRPRLIEYRIYDARDGARLVEGSIAAPPSREETVESLGRAMRLLGRETATAAFTSLLKSRPRGFGGSQ